MTDSTQEFLDPTGRAKWARWLLYAQAAISAIAVVSGVMEYSVLTGIKNATFASNAEMIAAAEANDTRQMIIGILQVALFIVAFIAFLMWVYRANRNARALTVQGMRFTPGWSVGWFFIPIANLWKPYQAVKEIWLASGNVEDAGRSNPQPLLGWWWFFWIVSMLVSNASLRLTLRAESIDELITANIVTIVADTLDVPSCLLTAAVVAAIHRLQMARASLQPPLIT